MTSGPRAHARLSTERAQALADNLRAERIRQGLTQEALAALIGTTVESYRRIEGARTNPTLATLYRVADGLGRSASSLLPD